MSTQTHLLLVHGALGCGAQLEPLRAKLAQRFDVRIVELEGHGNTAGAGDYSIDRFAANILGAMDSGGIDSAAIFGYSMGGYVALYLASEHPTRVHHVITLGTKFGWSVEIAMTETARLDPARIRAKVPKFAEQLEARHARAGGWELVLHRTARFMTSLGQSPIVDAEMLGKIHQPVRAMVGDRDSLVTIDETRAAAKAIASGELAVLPGTAHPIEQVDLTLLGAMVEQALDTRRNS